MSAARVVLVAVVIAASRRARSNSSLLEAAIWRA
jgi:hypothetical protein